MCVIAVHHYLTPGQRVAFSWKHLFDSFIVILALSLKFLVILNLYKKFSYEVAEVFRVAFYGYFQVDYLKKIIVQ